jgi:hypothetical protein
MLIELVLPYLIVTYLSFYSIDFSLIEHHLFSLNQTYSVLRDEKSLKNKLEEIVKI